MSVEWIEGKDRVTVWIDDEHGVDFEITIKNGEVVHYQQTSGGKMTLTPLQLDEYIKGLCALTNRYNLKKEPEARRP